VLTEIHLWGVPALMRRYAALEAVCLATLAAAYGLGLAGAVRARRAHTSLASGA